MAPPDAAALTITDFDGLIAHLEASWGRGWIEGLSPGRVRIGEREAAVTLLEAGADVGEGFEVALVVGAGEALSAALGRLASDRVQLLSLPTPAAIAEQAVRAALAAAGARRRAGMVDRLLDVGAALVAERDPARVLELILREARRMAGADAGSIFLVEAPEAEGDPARLHFRFAENASLPEARFDEFTLELSERSVVGACVLAGEAIDLADLYSDDPRDRSCRGRTFPHDRSIDERLGYQTRSLLTVPMQPPDGEVLGAIQLINARRDPSDARPLRSPSDFDERVVPFDAEAERLCRALAAQGAVALENARLYAEIEALFEGFVRASVKAIEQRDPTTSGHSERVAALTVGLAEAADRCEQGELRELHFSRESLRELEYAALLHDFGKVGVREDVLVKAKKLYPSQHERVLGRLAHMRTSVRLGLLERQLEGTGFDERSFADKLGELLHEVDEIERLIATANEPSVLGEDCSAGIRALAGRTFADGDGREFTLLDGADVESLLITRGSLTAGERREIQQHVVHTVSFLQQIPWGRRLKGVPEIAGKHHEYLDGSGYPDGVRGDKIPVQTRMMTIADIFDALTASDRPYKKAVPLARALDILEMEVRAGKLDERLFRLFVDAQIYRRIDLG